MLLPEAVGQQLEAEHPQLGLVSAGAIHHQIGLPQHADPIASGVEVHQVVAVGRRQFHLVRGSEGLAEQLRDEPVTEQASAQSLVQFDNFRHASDGC